jgi:small subunit ribosomal protein S20
MANTTSAKKATRKIARRTEINKARRSRVRGFLRKVEEAISSGDKDRSGSSAEGRAARTDARRQQGRGARQYGFAEDFAAVQPGQGDLA